jgi:hypothetical protein
VAATANTFGRGWDTATWRGRERVVTEKMDLHRHFQRDTFCYVMHKEWPWYTDRK